MQRADMDAHRQAASSKVATLTLHFLHSGVLRLLTFSFSFVLTQDESHRSQSPSHHRDENLHQRDSDGGSRKRYRSPSNHPYPYDPREGGYYGTSARDEPRRRQRDVYPYERDDRRRHDYNRNDRDRRDRGYYDRGYNNDDYDRRNRSGYRNRRDDTFRDRRGSSDYHYSRGGGNKKHHYESSRDGTAASTGAAQPESAATAEERDDRTVLCTQLSLRVDEGELMRFFEENAGEVHSVRLLRDKNSRKSKGIAYVELKNVASVGPALACNGTPLQRIPLNISLSEGARNRRAQNVTLTAAMLHTDSGRPTTVRILGLPPDIVEEDLVEIFGPFGEINGIELIAASVTADDHSNSNANANANSDDKVPTESVVDKDGKPIESITQGDVSSPTLREVDRCEARITFKHGHVASLCASKMQGFVLADNVPLAVSLLNGVGTAAEIGAGASSAEWDDASAGLVMTAERRAMLMANLQRARQPATVVAGDSTVSAKEAPPPPPPPPANEAVFLLLRKMYTQRDTSEDALFLKELEEDVVAEVNRVSGIVSVPFRWKMDSDGFEGLVYLKFESETPAKLVQQTFEGRWFNKRQLEVNPTDQNSWETAMEVAT